MKLALLGCWVLVGCAAPSTVPAARVMPKAAPSVAQPAPVAQVPAPAALNPNAELAARIAAAGMGSDLAYQRLAELTDGIGNRLSGSPALERAVLWARDRFRADGHEQVRLEAVRVPHWVRGAESARLLGPVPRALPVLALGGSVATPAQGLTAEVLVVSSFDELEARKLEAKAKIVVFDHPMAKDGYAGANYGAALPYRISGASRAAAYGAVAVLVRSLTARSLGVPHTGSMRYPDPKLPKIPAAAITVEDAELLHRLQQRGEPLRITLQLTPRTLPDADSANVIAELRGRAQPEEVVLIGAHLDSWDVGQGAQDDGAGVVVVMQALHLLRSLGLTPRRSVRAVLFTNEENGVRGGAQYALAHGSERHAAAFEIDAGAGAPLGFSTEGEPSFLPAAATLSAVLAPIGAQRMIAGYSGEDIGALKPKGVPLFGVMLDLEHYFDVHHSAADTLDKIEPENLKKSAIALATMAYLVADQEALWSTP